MHKERGYRDSPLHLRFRALPVEQRGALHGRLSHSRGIIRFLYKDSALEDFLRIAPFEFSFQDVLPARETRLKRYIESSLSDVRGQAIGVELGGPGSKVFSQFTPGFFARTAGISLHDYRDRIDPRIRKRDDARNHTVIPGNMLDKETQEAAVNWLQGSGIHVLFHRMLGGNSTIPEEPLFLGEQANFWYRLLATNGMMLSQVPYGFRSYMAEWAEYINNTYRRVLEVSEGGNDRSGYVMRLRKLEGAPENLPLLDAASVMERESKKVGFYTDKSIDK
jgi:hypothetical protein